MNKRNINLYISQIKDNLSGLNNYQVALYSSSCCERFISLYEEFDKENNFDKYNDVRVILNHCWDYALKKVGLNMLESAASKIIEYVPHGDDYPGIESSLALSTCVLLDSTIKLYLNIKEEFHTVEYSFDSIENLLLNKSDEDIYLVDDQIKERLFDNHLVKKEFEFQNEDITEIKNQKEIDENLIIKLRTNASKNQYHFSQFENWGK